MKKIFFSAIAITVVLVSCNQKTKDDSNMMNKNTTTTATDTTQTESQVADSKLYACPMHPEVQGNMDDKCSKCGMKLTEPVE